MALSRINSYFFPMWEIPLTSKNRNFWPNRIFSQAAQSRQPCVNSHQLSQWEALGTSHFWPPTKSTNLNRSLKNLSQVIRSTTSKLCKIWWISVKGSFGANRWNINYISFFIYTPFFKQRTYANHIFTLNGSNDADSRKGVFFWLRLILQPL